ncbi:MAG: hypothetical protein J7M11_05875 [Elusimicrobia bacterium]|nr:hypothetical protein [Elusimicrobiota bacterium]
MAEPNSVNLLHWGISIAVPAIAGLCGVGVGALLTSRRERIGRRYEFLSKQLTDFYSPLLSFRKEIGTIGKIRVKVGGAAEKVWHGLCERYKGNPTKLQKLTQEKYEKFDKIIDYDNEYLETETIPAYHKMIEIFRKNIYLAEPSTTKHFPDLIEFVNIWDRFLAGSLPGEVIKALNHSEESLYPLYEDLQDQHDKLRAKLAKGKV